MRSILKVPLNVVVKISLNTEISSSETLLSAGVTVDSVTVPTVEGLPGE